MLAIVIGVSLGAWWRSIEPENEPLRRPAAAESISAITPLATPDPKKISFQTLLGKWARPDGGYVLEIESTEENGKLVASYKNPRSINVFKAEASVANESVRVFIELRDANYPGSTYDLTYDVASDSLTGTYFQAVEQQQFDVVFARMK